MTSAYEPVDDFVQRWVAGTNGNLYVPLINKLPRYPIPIWPDYGTARGDSLSLDIGCGWGRWMMAAARAGYVPVGVDVKLEAVQAARRVMKAHNVKAYVVVADLAALPFRGEAFDLVFSYSVIQHAHKRKAAECIREVKRVLKDGCTCLIELPLKYGLTNVRYLLKGRTDQDNPESWVVRYYTWRELTELFGRIFGNIKVRSDCFCGIGVRPEDIDLLAWKYKPVVIASSILTWVARLFPPFTRMSDSVFVQARKVAN